MKEVEIWEMVDELNKLSQYETSETGELWRGLVGIEPVSHYGSDEFREAVEKEIKEQYELIKSRVRVVTTEKIRTYEEVSLEWDDE